MTSKRAPRRKPKSRIVTETLDWRGVTISVSYDPAWFVSKELGPDYAQAHLEVQVVTPEKAMLPITETGYRSHFLAPGVVENEGGPAAYVREWLDEAAQSRAWRRYEEESRQLCLF